MGDSITAGAATTYPGDLQALLGSGVQVQGFGHSGATMLSTGDVPYRQVPEYASATDFVANAGPSAAVDVIIMLGTNDTKSYNWTGADGGTPADRFRADCAAMVDHFAQLPTHPLVFLALPPEIYPNSFGISATTLDGQIIPIIKQVAAAKGVPVIDVNTATRRHPELFSDGVHPNDQGYTVVAQVMHDGLLPPNSATADAGQDDGVRAVGGHGPATQPVFQGVAAGEEAAPEPGGCSCRTFGRPLPRVRSVAAAIIVIPLARRRRRPAR